jgi:uncharacterized OsmC-like protein
MNEATQSVSIAQHADFRFALGFAPAAPTVLTDEAPPLGSGGGPTPVQLLAASVGNCLAASLLFALRKFKLAAEPLFCTVTESVRAAIPVDVSVSDSLGTRLNTDPAAG